MSIERRSAKRLEKNQTITYLLVYACASLEVHNAQSGIVVLLKGEIYFAEPLP